MASLETANQALEQKLKDADAEVELAHKSCREHQFRVKQLQEEVVFLERRRKADTAAKDVVKEVAEDPEAPPAALVASAPQQQEEDDTDIPRWMK